MKKSVGKTYKGKLLTKKKKDTKKTKMKK